MTKRLLLIGCLAFAFLCQAFGERWTEERAWAWSRTNGWLAGCDFLPSTAINQLEMFQADSFDVQTIDRELGWAESLGFNAVRVYLQDSSGSRIPKGF